RPHIVHSVLYTTPHKFLAVFVDNPRGEKWDFSPRLSISEYHQKLLEVDANGGRPRCVYSKYSANREMFYGVVWDYP
ncbi:MAG TPA: hypothetical protein PLY87_16910, partial [Planctomycetaceae bacterium]|nr:hypothetical protein [Planctomycetaceae bacterium]